MKPSLPWSAALLLIGTGALAEQAVASSTRLEGPHSTATKARSHSPAGRLAAAGRLEVTVVSGLLDRGRRYVAAGQRVALNGTADVSAADRSVIIEVSHGEEIVSRVAVQPGAGGRFAASFTARRSGRYLVSARQEVPTGRSYSARAAVRALRVGARPGSRGLKVRLLQRGLRALGFVPSSSGRFDGATARAVLAFRKTNGMGRRRLATRAVYDKLFRGIGAFRLRHPRAGKHVEFDWSRQVLVLARRGRAERVYHASSGKRSTPTVFGVFRFYRKQRGKNSKGMVHSNYFFRGYAIHGYRSVPIRPASHGCIRVPVPSASSIDRWIRLGDRVFVYR